MDAVDRAIEPSDAAAVVTVRYWAGARAAAGVDVETLPAVATVADLVARLGVLRPELRPVLEVASVLVDGRAGAGADPVPVGALVEVLPPFAGG